MKPYILITILLTISSSISAQTIVSLFDNNGTEVGQPSISGVGATQFVMRPDAIAIKLNTVTGTVEEAVFEVVFEEAGCQGQAYLRAEEIPRGFTWISSVPTPLPPDRILLFTQGEPVEEITWLSRWSGSPSGCDAVSTTGNVVKVSQIDPSTLGLVINPSGHWGYVPPLTAVANKVIPAGENIFCNGFESCPTQ